MKKRNLFIACLCAVVMTAAAAATSFAAIDAGTGIVGSKHDMRGFAEVNDGARDQYERVCAYCHTPHHAVGDMMADYMPLWSRTVTAEPVYVEYAGHPSSQDGFVPVDPLAGPSRLCMSCHDGVVAVDAYYGETTPVVKNQGDAFREIGVGLNYDLSNDHPIGFDYDAVATLDDEIRAADVAQFDGGAKVEDLLWEDPTFGNMMTCATCHDVHNGPTVSENWFLYGKQADSAFCTTCHIK